MDHKFKVGDKVKIVNGIYSVGNEGTVTQLNGILGPEKGGVVVANDTFFSGSPEYGEHGIWFPENWLEKSMCPPLRVDESHDQQE